MAEPRISQPQSEAAAAIVDDGSIKADSVWLAVLAIGALSLVLGLPSGVRYLFDTSSHAAGLALACAMVLPICVLFTRPQFGILPPLALSVFILAHTAVAYFAGDVDIERSVQSLGLLLLALVTAYYLSSWFFRLPDESVHLTAIGMIGILLAVAAFALAGIQPPTLVGSPMFPFMEPSHYALVAIPFLLYGCVTSTGMLRYVLIVVALLIAVLIKSLSLLVGIALITAVSLPVVFAIPLVASVILIGSTMDLDYFAQRVDFTLTSNNLSALVYIQGLEIIIDTLRTSLGWGLGFQQLGLTQIDSDAADIILRMTNDIANLTDGGFVAAKVIGEFGIFGVAAVGLYVYVAARAALALRAIAIDPRDYLHAPTLALCIILSFSVDIFVRGVAYFTASTFLFGCACFFMLDFYRRAKAKREAPGAEENADRDEPAPLWAAE